jgi:hypothetical protein
MEKKVLTSEELQSLRDLDEKQINLISTLGQIEYQIILLNKQKENLKSQIEVIESENTKLGKTLTEKYGNGNLNLETGEIISL